MSLSGRWLIVGFMLCAAPAWGQSSRPATSDADAKVEKIIMQLNSPRLRERKDAAEALLRVGPEALPILKKALESAPFEAREPLQAAIRGLEESQHGGAVIIAKQGGGGLNELQPGCVIYRINSVPIRSEQDYVNYWAKAELGRHEMFVRGPRGMDSLRWGTDPSSRCGPRVYVMDCGERYGQALSKGLAAANSGQYTIAIASLEEAERLGAPVKDSPAAQAIYANAQYQTGNVARSHEVFQQCVQRQIEKGTEDPWTSTRWTMSMVLEPTANSTGYELIRLPDRMGCRDGHFGLYIRQETMRHVPDSLQIRRSLGYHYVERLNRYVDGIALMSRELQPREWSEEAQANRSTALSFLFTSFQALRMMPEATEILRLVTRGDADSKDSATAIEVMEQFGDIDAAMKLHHKKVYERVKGQMDLRWPFHEMLRFCVRYGRIDEAKALIKAAPPEELMDDDVTLPFLLCGWRDLADTWKTAARRAARGSSTDRGVLYEAFMILARQPEVDPDELDRLMKKYYRLPDFMGNVPPTDELPVGERLIMALQRGRYDEAAAIVDSVKGGRQDNPARTLVEFMKQHGDSFTGPAALWRGTWSVTPVGKTAWILVTRGGQIGYMTGEGGVVELPLPRADYALTQDCVGPWAHESAFVISTSERTIALCDPSRPKYPTPGDLKAVYTWRPGESKWTHMMNLPARDVPKVVRAELPSLLDELHEYVQRQGYPIDIVYPTGDLYRAFSDETLFLLADGSWIQIHSAREGRRSPAGGKAGSRPAASPRIRPLNKYVAEKLGEPVCIYAQHTIGSARREFCLFTDRGLCVYNEENDSVRRLTLPDRKEPAPVTLLPRGEGSGIRFGLMPHMGGATYRLDARKFEISPDRGINESYPILYWYMRSEEDNRKAVVAELQKQGIAWPLQYEMQAASSQPAAR